RTNRAPAYGSVSDTNNECQIKFELIQIFRSAAGTRLGEADAGAMKRLNGSLRALRQHLLLGDERAVEIRNHGEILRFAHLRLCVLAQSKGRHVRQSRASSSPAAVGPLLPA